MKDSNHRLGRGELLRMVYTFSLLLRSAMLGADLSKSLQDGDPEMAELFDELSLFIKEYERGIPKTKELH